MKTAGMDTRAYLIRLPDKAAGITISDLTLRGPQLHGAIFGLRNKGLHLHHLKIQDFLWSGVRTFGDEGGEDPRLRVHRRRRAVGARRARA